MEQPLQLKKKPQVYVMVGKPESGKSHLVKSLIYDFQKKDPYFRFILAFVKTKFNSDYDYLEDQYVYESFDEEKLRSHIEKLREYRRKTNKPVPPNLIIFDDLLGDIDWYSPWMTNWLCSFRHTNTSIIMTAQYLMGAKSVSTCLRECTNVAFIYNSKFKNSLKALYEAYGQLFKNEQEFVERFQTITKEKFTCMVYKADIDELEDNYVSFKAPEVLKDFKLKYKI